MATRIDGKGLAATIREEIKEKVKTHEITPGLAVVLVGDRKDSATYVRMKNKAAEEAGFKFTLIKLPADTSEEKIIEEVEKLNKDDSIHGILVQLPLPDHCNERAVCDRVLLSKDVDGFHPQNIGALALKGRTPKFIPGTPKGCIEILDRIGFEIAGKSAVVLGRSNIVGMPMALLLLHRSATVTVCHSRTSTEELEAAVKKADIVVAAVGRAKFVPGSWIKKGAVVLDVGINAVDDSSKKSGFRLVGDVDYESAKEVECQITPVPGGIGPMTVAMLLQQTFESALSFKK